MQNEPLTVKNKTIEVVLLKRLHKSDVKQFRPIELVIAGLRGREWVSELESRLKEVIVFVMALS